MLAIVRMNHLTKANTVGTNSNSSTTNDEHPSTILNNERMLLLNGNMGQGPATPRDDLNTPNTCTKNTTFFYDMPSAMHTPTLIGKIFFFRQIFAIC
jgi:hypothetical protein